MSISRKLIGAGAKEAAYVDDVFSTYVYAGTGADQDIENGIDLAGEGGLVWSKSRDFDWGHSLVDTERGPSTGSVPGKTLQSQSSGAPTAQNDVVAFTGNGYAIGVDDFVNKANEDYVSWTWRKAPKFFDCVTYTGDGVQNRGIPHRLSTTPGMVITRSLLGGRSWDVWHKGLNVQWTGGTTAGDITGGNETSSITLNSGGAQYASGFFTYMNSTAIGLYGTRGDANIAGEEYVAYVFAHDDSDDGLIQCGSYTGNGVADGPEIDLGWEPQWLLIKKATGNGYWTITDAMRGLGGKGADKPYLVAEYPYVEATSDRFRTTSTGFKIDDSNGLYNESGEDYIYIAIRRPNKPAEEFEPEELFAMQRAASLTKPAWRSEFPVDFAWNRDVTTSDQNRVASRLTDQEYLYTASNGTSIDEASYTFDYSNGWNENAFAGLATWQSWMWRRAPGFFDVVAYTGNGVFGHMVNHNLGVVPEMIWIKNRGRAGSSWPVYHAGNTSEPETDAVYLDKTDATSDSSTFWHDTSPTATQFCAGRSSSVNNQSGDNYIAYLFASVPGICDIGSYTGTGNSLRIDCGFTTGTSFLLIKRTDGQGGWFVWDSERGMNGGVPINYLRLDTIASEQPGQWLATVTEGFNLNPMNSYNTEVNVSGHEYIYMAIAQ